MDQTTYTRWWELHVRVARGDELDAAEQATYEAGLIELDAEEKAQWADGDLTRLRRLKAEPALAAQCTWERTARATIAVYERVLGGGER